MKFRISYFICWIFLIFVLNFACISNPQLGPIEENNTKESSETGIKNHEKQIQPKNADLAEEEIADLNVSSIHSIEIVNAADENMQDLPVIVFRRCIVDSSGNIWVPNNNNSQLIKINPSTKKIHRYSLVVDFFLRSSSDCYAAVKNSYSNYSLYFLDLKNDPTFFTKFKMTYHESGYPWRDNLIYLKNDSIYSLAASLFINEKSVNYHFELIETDLKSGEVVKNKFNFIDDIINYPRAGSSQYTRLNPISQMFIKDDFVYTHFAINENIETLESENRIFVINLDSYEVSDCIKGNALFNDKQLHELSTWGSKIYYQLVDKLYIADTVDQWVEGNMAYILLPLDFFSNYEFSFIRPYNNGFYCMSKSKNINQISYFYTTEWQPVNDVATVLEREIMFEYSIAE